MLYAAGGIGLIATGVWALVLRSHLMRKLLALNVMASGIFLVLVGAGSRETAGADPVPQAMVITGIVVSLAATALGLALTLRIARATGQPRLPENRHDAGTNEDAT
jgi:multicomponent Na+:H+ antiporter subunit C